MARKNIENSLRYALKTSKFQNFRLPPDEKRSRDSLIKACPLKKFPPSPTKKGYLFGYSKESQIKQNFAALFFMNHIGIM